MATFVKFDRSDGGGPVFVNPDHVTGVVQHDNTGKISQIIFSVETNTSFAVVLGTPNDVVRALGGGGSGGAAAGAAPKRR